MLMVMCATSYFKKNNAHKRDPSQQETSKLKPLFSSCIRLLASSTNKREKLFMEAQDSEEMP